MPVQSLPSPETQEMAAQIGSPRISGCNDSIAYPEERASFWDAYSSPVPPNWGPPTGQFSFPDADYVTHRKWTVSPNRRADKHGPSRYVATI